MPQYLELLSYRHEPRKIKSLFVQLRLLLSRRFLSAQVSSLPNFSIWLTSWASAATSKPTFVCRFCRLGCGCRHRQLSCCPVSFSFGRPRSSGLWGDKECLQVLSTTSMCFIFWNPFTLCGAGKPEAGWAAWCLPHGHEISVSYPHFHPLTGSRSLWFL